MEDLLQSVTMTSQEVSTELDNNKKLWSFADESMRESLCNIAASIPCLGSEELASCLRISQALPPLSYSVSDLKQRASERSSKAGHFMTEKDRVLKSYAMLAELLDAQLYNAYLSNTDRLPKGQPE